MTNLDFTLLGDFTAYKDFLVASIIFLTFVVLSWLANRTLRVYAKRLSGLTETTLDDEILEVIRRPICLAILILGLYVSISFIPAIDAYSNEVNQFFRIAVIFLLSYSVVRVLNGVVNWYVKEVAVKTQTTFDDKYLPVFQKIISIIIYLIAGLLVLGELDIEVTPLVASLGIGGLAVALALQDTLANFFAGAYIVADKPFEPGDYVDVEGGISGYVQEVGWRSTKIKTLPNNLIVVPNSKLSQGIITNYHLPEKEMSVVIPVSVSYDSDLEKVEAITVEVAEKVLKNTHGGAKKFKPTVRYTELGDSGIKFSVVLRVNEFTDRYPVTHEFIKALMKKYHEEGVVVPYPTRTVHMVGK